MCVHCSQSCRINWVKKERFDFVGRIVIRLMRPVEALRSSGQIEADACSGLA